MQAPRPREGKMRLQEREVMGHILSKRREQRRGRQDYERERKRERGDEPYSRARIRPRVRPVFRQGSDQKEA